MESEMQTLKKHLLDDTPTELSYPDKFASDTEFNSRPRRRLRFDRHRKLSIAASTVRAYSICEKLEVNEIFLNLSTFFSNIKNKAKLSREVAVVELEHEQYLFFFEFGAVVIWSLGLDKCNRIIADLQRFAVKPHASTEVETIGFEEGEKFAISQDLIELGSKDIFEKLAVSYAMAQSAQLSQYENAIDITIESTEKIQHDLAERGEIKLSQKEITKKIGQLFRMRAIVNLQSELLDTPDCFWEDDSMEKVYLKTKSYLDMDKRLKILNQRLEIVRELLDLMNDELHSKHESNLEWIIIWLILVEVVCYIGWEMLVKDIFGYFRD